MFLTLRPPTRCQHRSSAGSSASSSSARPSNGHRGVGDGEDEDDEDYIAFREDDPWVQALILADAQLRLVERCKLDPSLKATCFQPLNLRVHSVLST